jgi:protein involved in sex pheromone biosynthesis
MSLDESDLAMQGEDLEVDRVRRGDGMRHVRCAINKHKSQNSFHAGEHVDVDSGSSD